MSLPITAHVTVVTREQAATFPCALVGMLPTLRVYARVKAHAYRLTTASATNATQVQCVTSLFASDSTPPTL